MNSEGSAPKSTHEYARGVVDTLCGAMTDEGQLIDPVSGRPIPGDQYAQTCFAVAAVRTAEGKAPDEAAALRGAASTALDWFLSRGTAARGHGEFNSFALLELLTHLDRTGEEFDVPTERLYDALRFDSRLDSREGNNWLLLRGLCHARLAALGRGLSHELWYRRIRRLVGRWVLRDGLIADEPRLPLGRIKTPLTYHAKLAALCVRLGVLRDDATLLEWGRRGFLALSAVTLPTGEALYFGRSENTVFGYATALDGITRLERALDDGDGSVVWLQTLKRRLTRYLLSSFDIDSVNCQPSRHDVHVDTYVVDGVYAAYAAMLLLGIPDITASATRPINQSAAPSVTHDTVQSRVKGPGGDSAYLQRSGLCRITGARSALGTATTGQLSRTRGVLDPRYAGLVPHSFVVDGRPVCPGTPADFLSTGRLPYLPTVTHEGFEYAPVTWSKETTGTVGQVTTIQGRANWHRVGVPETGSEDGGAGGTDRGTESLLERARHLVSRSAKTTVKKAKVDIVLNELSDRPTSLPVTGRRALHYLREADTLVLQTLVQADRPVDFTPTSVVVANAYASDDHPERHEAEDGAVTTRSTVTDRTTARWICPEPRRTVRYWSTIVVDPVGRVSSASTTDGETRLETRVSMHDGETHIVGLSTEDSDRTVPTATDHPDDGSTS